MRRPALGLIAVLTAGALLATLAAVPGRALYGGGPRSGAPRQDATPSPTTPPTTAPTTAPTTPPTASATPIASPTLGARPTLGATAAATVTSTATLTATGTATSTTATPAPSTTPARATATPTVGATPALTATPTVAPTGAPTAAHRIHLPLLRRTDGAFVADRVAARLMAMLERPDERARLVVWDWEAGVALVALMTAYGDGRDPKAVRWVDDWLRRAAREGWIDLDAPQLTLPNHIAPVWAALLRDDAIGDGRHAALVDAAADWLTRPPSAGGAPRVAIALPGFGSGWPGAWAHLPDRPEVWDDTLFMAAPLLARAGQRRADMALIGAAADQVSAHAAALRDPSNGLWFHGWSVTDGHMSGGRWARGNAWVALALTEVIDSLPEDHRRRPELITLLWRQLAGLALVQPRGGLWHTEVLQRDFVTETSGSAGITAAMYRAIAAGWSPQFASLRANADRGYAAVLGQIAADGAVRGVSAGTGVPSAAQGVALYDHIDASRVQPYGQGLALLMLAARERADAAAGRRAP